MFKKLRDETNLPPRFSPRGIWTRHETYACFVLHFWTKNLARKMFSPNEENVRKKFIQKMFKNMKHLLNMFKKRVIFRLTVRSPQDEKSGKGLERGCPMTNLEFLGNIGPPDEDKTIDMFVELTMITRTMIGTRTSEDEWLPKWHSLTNSWSNSSRTSQPRLLLVRNFSKWTVNRVEVRHKFGKFSFLKLRHK